MYLILKEIFKEEENVEIKSSILAFVSSIILASISNVIYIRMYALATLNIVITTFLHIKLLESKGLNFMNSVKCEIKKLIIPTYPEPPAEELPMFAENRVHQRTSGRPYPNKVVLKVNREEKIDKEYTVVVLENEYLKIEILRK